ncbi:hypothetical protein, partial [Escherichia albertii]|uniref:hypothetical protein n=1 Tax=Escherichia albertii TaxID=208962 RepID=UPI001BB04DA5
FDFLFDTCSCQTARCFNKSKGVLITGSKLKAFQNPQPSWGFSVHNKNHARCIQRAVVDWLTCNSEWFLAFINFVRNFMNKILVCYGDFFLAWLGHCNTYELCRIAYDFIF